MLEIVASNLEIIGLFLPLGIVLWEGAFLSFNGGKGPWKQLGAAVYLSGFSVGIGGLCQAQAYGEGVGDELVAAFILLLIVGGALPFVAILARDEFETRRPLGKGPEWARRIGVFTYCFCVYLVIELGGSNG